MYWYLGNSTIRRFNKIVSQFSESVQQGRSYSLTHERWEVVSEDASNNLKSLADQTLNDAFERANAIKS